MCVCVCVCVYVHYPVLYLVQVSTDSGPLDIESLRRMHENVKRSFQTVAHSSPRGMGGASDFVTPQPVYNTQTRGSYTQPPSSKFTYQPNTSYSENWPYSSETHPPPPQPQPHTHSPDDQPTTHSGSVYYHTPSTYEGYSYVTSTTDTTTSKGAAASVPADETSSSSRLSYTEYNDDLTSQMNKLDIGGSHRSYQSTDGGDYVSTTLGQSSPPPTSYSVAAIVSSEETSVPPYTSSQYDVTASSGHHPTYGSISSMPSSSGMTVTSGSNYPVVPTARSETEQQLRERVRQLEQMVKQKDVTIEEQRSQLKYSGPQTLYQDPTIISPGPATLYSSGSIPSPHHSGLIQHAYGGPPSISPQGTMQHVQYYSHTPVPAAGGATPQAHPTVQATPAGTAFYTPQSALGYSSHRWSGPLSTPVAGGQYPSPPGSLPAQQTVTPPGTHLVGVLHHSSPILMPAAAAAPPPPAPRQVHTL